MGTNQVVEQLKASEEDFEWYPTTQAWGNNRKLEIAAGKQLLGLPA